MSLWQRMKRVFRANANAALNKLENPEHELALLETELRQQHQQARIRLVEALAEQKKLEQEEARIQEDIDRWERRAIQAVESGNDDLARQVLQEKFRTEQTWAYHREQVRHQQEAIEILKDTEKTLVAEMSAAEKRRQQITHRLHHAQALGQMGQFYTAQPHTPAGTFAEIEKSVAALEEQVALQQDVDERVTAVVIEQHLLARQKEQEKQAALQQELTALKQKIKSSDPRS